MPTRSDDQQPSHRSGAPPQDPSRDATPLSVPNALSLPDEPEVVYELRDDDFILVDPDETIEFQTGTHMPRPAPPPPVPDVPPLPAWAAASRAMLDGTNGEGAQAAIELREAREDLIRFARQTYAREIYVQEVERALASAQGRVRGQAFRIAELEQTLRTAEARASHAARELELRAQEARAHALERRDGMDPMRAADRHATYAEARDSETPLRAADAESLRAMLELDLRAGSRTLDADALQMRVWDAREAPASSQPSAAGTLALLSLREHVARTQPPFAPGQYIVEAQPTRRATAKRKPTRARDDLQRIKGIGPSMAERLAKAGVRSFESVAGWKAKDLTRMAEKLGVSRARIERQEWVKQARTLSRKR